MQEVKNNLMNFNTIIEDTNESNSVKEQMSHMNHIHDVNYKKSDLKEEVAKLMHCWWHCSESTKHFSTVT